MRYKTKTDCNQESIVKALRKCGCSVQILAQVGAGCPDLLIGYHGKNILAEVKTDKGTLTDDQVVWRQYWRGQVAVVRSANDAIELINKEG